MTSPELQDLLSGDPKRLAVAFHAIACEIESGCILVRHIEWQRGPMDTGIQVGEDEWTFTLTPTGQHEDDILVGRG